MPYNDQIAKNFEFYLSVDKIKCMFWNNEKVKIIAYFQIKEKKTSIRY